MVCALGLCVYMYNNHVICKEHIYIYIKSCNLQRVTVLLLTFHFRCYLFSLPNTLAGISNNMLTVSAKSCPVPDL